MICKIDVNNFVIITGSNDSHIVEYNDSYYYNKLVENNYTCTKFTSFNDINFSNNIANNTSDINSNHTDYFETFIKHNKSKNISNQEKDNKSPTKKLERRNTKFMTASKSNLDMISSNNNNHSTHNSSLFNNTTTNKTKQSLLLSGKNNNNSLNYNNKTLTENKSNVISNTNTNTKARNLKKMSTVINNNSKLLSSPIKSSMFKKDDGNNKENKTSNNKTVSILSLNNVVINNYNHVSSNTHNKSTSNNINSNLHNASSLNSSEINDQINDYNANHINYESHSKKEFTYRENYDSHSNNNNNNSNNASNARIKRALNDHLQNCIVEAVEDGDLHDEEKNVDSNTNTQIDSNSNTNNIIAKKQLHFRNESNISIISSNNNNFFSSTSPSKLKHSKNYSNNSIVFSQINDTNSFSNIFISKQQLVLELILSKQYLNYSERYNIITCLKNNNSLLKQLVNQKKESLGKEYNELMLKFGDYIDEKEEILSDFKASSTATQALLFIKDNAEEEIVKSVNEYFTNQNSKNNEENNNNDLTNETNNSKSSSFITGKITDKSIKVIISFYRLLYNMFLDESKLDSQTNNNDYISNIGKEDNNIVNDNDLTQDSLIINKFYSLLKEKYGYTQLSK